MTLMDFLSGLRADLEDPSSPALYVVSGILSDEEEAWVQSPEYGKAYPYAYILNFDNTVAQTYDNGSARYLAPFDLVFESRNLEEPEKVQALWDYVFDNVRERVDEVRPGVRLAEKFARTGGYTVQSTRKGFIEAVLRLETTTVHRPAPPRLA